MMSLSVGGCMDPAVVTATIDLVFALPEFFPSTSQEGQYASPAPAPRPTIEELEAKARDCDRISQYRLVLRLQDSEPERALYWLRLSAHDGYAPAQYDYANVNRYGSDLVAPDNVQAYLWYSLALFDHNYSIDPSGVAFWRDALAVQMTEAEIAEAERLVAGWEPAPCEPETA